MLFLVGQLLLLEHPVVHLIIGATLDKYSMSLQGFNYSEKSFVVEGI